MRKDESSPYINQFVVKCFEPENFVESRQVIILCHILLSAVTLAGNFEQVNN